MNLTKHAKRRCAHRGLSEDELAILSLIGHSFQQKGGSTLCTISNADTKRWLNALKEVLRLLRSSDQYPNRSLRRKIKLINHLIKKISAKHRPYLVICDENNTVITCGYYYGGKIKRH